jgi:hypothetical protein
LTRRINPELRVKRVPDDWRPGELTDFTFHCSFLFHGMSSRFVVCVVQPAFARELRLSGSPLPKETEPQGCKGIASQTGLLLTLNDEAPLL